MIVRRDWMDNLGLQDPENLDEFVALMAAFANNDPDGNGFDDTIGYNVNFLNALGKWVILGIAPECNVYTWVEEDGRFVPSWTTEAFRDVVSTYSLLYSTGGLDPEFYSKSPNNVMEDFASGKLGALEYKSSPNALLELKDKWDKLNDLPFEDCVDILMTASPSSLPRTVSDTAIPAAFSGRNPIFPPQWTMQRQRESWLCWNSSCPKRVRKCAIMVWRVRTTSKRTANTNVFWKYRMRT